MISIAPLRPEQIDAALELFIVQLAEHRVKIDAGRSREILRTIIADEQRGFVLAATTREGEIAGVALVSAFLALEHGGESGWLEELYVSPDWRQHGVGTRLVAEIIRVAKEHGWRALDLEVEADHQRVISLYERHGFKAHTRSHFYLKL